MNEIQRIHLRITRSLYASMHEDLQRPHAHAYERVGFLFAKMGNGGAEPLLLLATHYLPVTDEHYIEDPTCGAKIGSEAIREAMQQVLSTGECCFHVHMHEHDGEPGFGLTDRKSLPGVVGSLRNANPRAVHGMLVFSNNHGIADVRLPNTQELAPVNQITIVGQPMAFFERTHDV